MTIAALSESEKWLLRTYRQLEPARRRRVIAYTKFEWTQQQAADQERGGADGKGGAAGWH